MIRLIAMNATINTLTLGWRKALPDNTKAQTKRRPHMKALFPALLFVFLLIGCSKATTEQYNQLKGGMTYDEVQKILGKPDTCDDVLTARNCTWRNGEARVSVSFVGGKVLFYGAENLR